MKHIIYLHLFLFIQSACYAQSKNGPAEVTKEIEKKINQEITKESGLLKSRLTDSKEATDVIEFTLDTFRIEKYRERFIDYDWSTAGMRSATYDAADKYDRLLNKYYKKLLLILKQVDKSVLINVQKSWISFRDNELKLIGTISKDEYSGGGTIQGILNASDYLEIIKQRTFTIYQHYLRAAQIY